MRACTRRPREPHSHERGELIYLRTGRKGVAMDDAEQHWDHWKASGIRYVVCLRPAVPLPSVSRPFNVLFQTSRHRLWILEI